MYSDGACRGNPGKSSIGVVFYDENNEEIASLSEAIGVATNNVAEYTALIYGLEYAVKHHYKQLAIKADSELMIKQLKGEYKVKNENIKPLFIKAKALIAKLEAVTYKHVVRELNKRADELANMALDA